MKKIIIIMFMLFYLSINSVFAYTNSSTSDTRLMSLIVRGATLSPQFVSTVTSYSAKTANSSITISAMAASSQATVSGTGSFNLSTGANSFNVVVKAPDGQSQTYKLSITRTSKTTDQQTKKTTTSSAVNVTYKGKEYTVADNLSKVPFPENFGISSTVVGTKTVVAIKHKKAALYAVYLRDSNNKGAFYIVKNKKVSGLLNTVTIDDHEYVVMSHGAPADNMEKVTLTLGTKSVTGYKEQDRARKNYTLVYLLGNHTQPCFYSYEESEGTLQKYVASSSQNSGINTVLLLTSFFFGIAFLIVVFKYRSFKKMSVKRYRYYSKKVRDLESHKEKELG